MFRGNFQERLEHDEFACQVCVIVNTLQVKCCNAECKIAAFNQKVILNNKKEKKCKTIHSCMSVTL